MNFLKTCVEKKKSDRLRSIDSDVMLIDIFLSFSVLVKMLTKDGENDCIGQSRGKNRSEPDVEPVFCVTLSRQGAVKACQKNSEKFSPWVSTFR